MQTTSLPSASTLWGGLVNDTAVTNGITWKKVAALTGNLGDWSQVGRANGENSFIVLDCAGGGLMIIPEYSAPCSGYCVAAPAPGKPSSS